MFEYDDTPPPQELNFEPMDYIELFWDAKYHEVPKDKKIAVFTSWSKGGFGSALVVYDKYYDELWDLEKEGSKSWILMKDLLQIAVEFADIDHYKLDDYKLDDLQFNPIEEDTPPSGIEIVLGRFYHSKEGKLMHTDFLQHINWFEASEWTKQRYTHWMAQVAYDLSKEQ